jgi:hypothetical protein
MKGYLPISAAVEFGNSYLVVLPDFDAPDYTHVEDGEHRYFRVNHRFEPVPDFVRYLPCQFRFSLIYQDRIGVGALNVLHFAASGVAQMLGAGDLFCRPTASMRLRGV